MLFSRNRFNWELGFCPEVMLSGLVENLFYRNTSSGGSGEADIGVLPSYTEQCSYVGLEMLAHRLPIVASDGFGMRCMFQEQANIRVAHIGNVKQLDGYKSELVSSTLKLLYLKEKEKQGELGVDYQRKECMKDLYLSLLDA